MNPTTVLPILSLINQTATLLKTESQADNTPFFGLIIVENLHLLPFFNQENTSFKILSLADFLAQEFSQYYDLAVLILESAEKINPNTVTTIQRCRDVFARHSLLFAPVIATGSHSADFIAFGFSKISPEPIMVGEQTFLAWQFNLYDYKQLPDWFNSRFWANPENWNKFRW